MADYVAAVDQGTTSTRCMILTITACPWACTRWNTSRFIPRPVGSSTTRWKSGIGRPGRHQGCAEEGWSQGHRHRRRRRDQPARDYAGVGQEYRQTLLQCHRLAGHAHRQTHQGTSGQRGPEPLPRQGRSAVGDLLLRPQGALDPGQCARGQGAAAERGDAVFGNMDTWIIWNLTGGPTAART